MENQHEGSDKIQAISQWQRTPCQCGQDTCCALMRSFNSLNDQRGRVVQIPIVTDAGRKRHRKKSAAKDFKITRWAHHLGLSRAAITENCVDNRSQKTNVVQTRRATPPKKRTRKYLALHHFHPVVIRHSIAKSKSATEFHLVADLSRDFVRVHIGENSGYTNADRCDGSYIPVPSYSMESATGDLQGLQETARLEQLAAQACALQRGKYLKRRQPDNSSAPLGERAARRARVTPQTAERQAAEIQRMVDEVNDYQRAIALLDRNRHFEEQRNAQVQSEMVAKATDENLQAFLAGATTGITRFSITNDQWHKNNPNMSKKLFGMKWNHVKSFVLAMFNLRPRKLTQDDRNKPLNMFEECVITLLWNENDIDQVVLAKYFGKDGHSVVSRAIKRWEPLWGEVGLHLSILPFVDADFIDSVEPAKNRQLGLEKVGAIIDGKDFLTETARADRVANVAQHSNKMDHSAFRVMTWSLSCGLVFEATRAFLARSSEKALIELWGKHGRLKNIPVGYLILGDKGFEGTSGSYPNFNTILHPAFLYGNSQFSTEQIGHNLKACQLRYTCETVYARVTARQSVSGVIRREKFNYFEHMCDWAHGRANLYRPLQMPDGFEAYFENNVDL